MTETAVALIRPSALQHNLRRIRSASTGCKIMAVIKANAYGHGLAEVGCRLEQAGAPCLGVAYVEEGIALRDAGVTIPIQVLGGAVARQIPLFLERGLTLTAPSVDKVHQIQAAAQSG